MKKRLTADRTLARGWKGFRIPSLKVKNGLDPFKPVNTVSNEQLGGTAKSGRIVPFASQGGGVFWAYDKETLAIYVYDARNGQSFYLGKIAQLGKAMDQAGVSSIPFLR